MALKKDKKQFLKGSKSNKSRHRKNILKAITVREGENYEIRTTY